jgi:hypothetical protein
LGDLSNASQRCQAHETLQKSEARPHHASDVIFWNFPSTISRCGTRQDDRAEGQHREPGSKMEKTDRAHRIVQRFDVPELHPCDGSHCINSKGKVEEIDTIESSAFPLVW